MVGVDLTVKAINVEDQIFWFDSLSIDTIKDALPENVNPNEVSYVNWFLNYENQTGFYMSDGATILFDNTEENYNKWVKPYVDIWQAEKDRQEQEQAEAEAEWNKFENRQARALTQLNEGFETTKQIAHIKSSLGFTIDANQTANENITGLLVTIGDGTTQFCDYNNVFHEVDKADLETMQTEIIQNAQYLYQQKWSYRTQIEECTDGDGLDEILAQIEFKYKDFTQ